MCFLEQISEKRIGSAEFLGLYYFENFPSMSSHIQVVMNKSLSREQNILLLHYKLGHMSFVYLRHLFPSLFKKNDFFQCEIAKHKRVY